MDIYLILFFSSPVSRVVFNGKRPTSSTRSPSSSEIFTPAHEENVRFIYEGKKPEATGECLCVKLVIIIREVSVDGGRYLM